ncbi:MAG TPA: ATP-binding protein [Chloroflexia bacterium]|nr:ATP-binding protein [Chloroflexia bacterium]
MNRLSNLAPVSNATYVEPTCLQPVEKCPVQQLLNQIISNTLFFQSKNQASFKLATLLEASKTDNLESELETLKLLGAGIAHDLANVLTIITANLELARLPQGQLKLERILQEVESASDRAKALSEQMAILFQGKNLIKEKVSLTELLIASSALGLSGSEIKCNYKLASNLPLLHVAKTQISQVITNLVLNAVQAMSSGGELEVEAETVELAGNNAASLTPGKYVQIKIRDHGVGIPAEHLKKVFKPYFTTKPRGKGVGLALSYLIVQQHKGHISVESQVGAGSTFRLLLPVK